MNNIDKNRVKNAFLKAVNSYDDSAYVQKEMAEYLSKFLSQEHKDKYFKSVLEIGCGTGFLTKEIISSNNVEQYYLNDLSDKYLDIIKDKIDFDFKFIAGDIEEVYLENKYDLIISNAAIQWLNDIPIFFKKMDCHLNNGGLFIFSTFGDFNLYEINELTGKSLEYDIFTNLRNFFEKSDEIILDKREKRVIYFDSPQEILKHLKNSGVTGFNNKIWTISHLKRFISDYERFKFENRYPLTYDIIYFGIKKG